MQHVPPLAWTCPTSTAPSPSTPSCSGTSRPSGSRATPSSSSPTRRSRWRSSRPGGPALSHLGIRVDTTDEVEGASSRLKDSGLVTLDERDTACCYARQDKVWVADPAGNRWEVYTVLGDIEDEDDHAPSRAPAARRRPMTRLPAAPGAGDDRRDHTHLGRADRLAGVRARRLRPRCSSGRMGRAASARADRRAPDSVDAHDRLAARRLACSARSSVWSLPSTSAARSSTSSSRSATRTITLVTTFPEGMSPETWEW